MRVLFWTYSFWPTVGGLELCSARLLQAMHERDHEFVVVTSQRSPSQPSRAEYKQIPIYRFPFLDPSSYTNIDQLGHIRQQVVRLKRTFAPDLIHMNYGVDVGNFFHLTSANTHPAPLLVTVHGPWSKGSSLGEGILRAADWVVGVSAATLDRERKLVPQIVPRSSIIYNGLESPPVRPTPLPVDAPRVLCVGRLSPEKRIDLAVKAFAAILEHFPQARLLIAGDGPTRTALEQQAAELDISHGVDFIGWVPPEDVPALINTATLILIPSQHEGFPLVALEAAWMARPIVASQVGGLPEVVVDGETGLLVEPDDPKRLAEAAIFLLAHPTTASQMGQAARRRAQDLFSWERHVNAYDTLYRQLVGDWRKKSASPKQAKSSYL